MADTKFALPVRAPAKDTVDIDGTSVSVRGLTRAETIRLGQLYGDDPNRAETFLVASGTDITEDEAEAWRNATDAPSADLVINKIVELSAISEVNGKDPQ